MSELRDLLSQALGTTSSVPAEPKLSAGVEATAYWTFAPILRWYSPGNDCRLKGRPSPRGLSG